MKPQILILGSTGRTGKWLLEEALQRGYAVNVLVRDASKILPQTHLTVFEGKPDATADLQKAAKGCEAVLSTLNISRTSDFPWARLRASSDFLSKTMQNIAKTGVKRVIFTSAPNPV
jgi:putative NADH-flavin reductase